MLKDLEDSRKIDQAVHAATPVRSSPSLFHSPLPFRRLFSQKELMRFSFELRVSRRFLYTLRSSLDCSGQVFNLLLSNYLVN